MDSVGRFNPGAVIVQTASPVRLDPGPDLVGKRVLVVEDGPTVTHGGMPHGAAPLRLGAPEWRNWSIRRPYAVGSIAETYAAYPRPGPGAPRYGLRGGPTGRTRGHHPGNPV